MRRTTAHGIEKWRVMVVSSTAILTRQVVELRDYPSSPRATQWQLLEYRVAHALFMQAFRIAVARQVCMYPLSMHTDANFPGYNL